MNFPLILIVGPSGQGKSTSLQHLPPERTTVINCERKFLPFANDGKFNQVYPDHAVKCQAEFEKILKDKSSKTQHVVYDSMTKYLELLLAHSKVINKGYDIYNYLNDNVTKFLETAKGNTDKLIFMTAIDERVEYMKDSGATTTSRRAWCPGKQWEGKIEKEFTIVLFTDVKGEKGKDSEYRFITNNDGSHSAKSPKGMFDMYIPNDLNFVANRVMEFYGLKFPGQEEGEKEQNIVGEKAKNSILNLPITQ